MSDETKKSDADKNIDSKGKSESDKKPTTASKKVKAKSSSEPDKASNKKKVIEKLQAMGVMSGGKKETINENDSEHSRFPKPLIATVAGVLVVSAFVWALNKNAAQEPIVSNVSTTQPGNYQAAKSNQYNQRQPSRYNPYTNNSGYPGANHPTQVEVSNNYKQQRKNWIQQQQKYQQQQRLQQQKWLKQQQAQYKKWVQQQRAQQKQQQQSWNQQQPNYAYQPYTGYQGQQQQPQAQNYNYAPGYQQPQQYYRR